MTEKIDKPWGKEVILCKNDSYVGKILYINKGHRISKQYHNLKMESLYMIKGYAKIQVGDISRLLYQKDIPSFPSDITKYTTIDILPRVQHRIEALEDCIFIEFSTNQLSDIVRIEDDYKRV